MTSVKTDSNTMVNSELSEQEAAALKELEDELEADQIEASKVQDRDQTLPDNEK